MKSIRIGKLCAVATLVLTLAAAMQAQTFSVLYNFGEVSLDAAYPQYSGIIAQGRDGNLYTTTPYGGANDVGAVIRITPAGQVTVLYNFSIVDPDEGYPFGGLTLGADGNLYGATVGNLDHSNGKVFKVTSSGQLTFLHTFGPGEGRHAFAPPILASDGNLYGTTTQGGAMGYGSVYKITSAGQFKTIASFDYYNGYYAIAPLVQGTDGNFYGTTWEGGAAGIGTVFRVTNKGKITTLHNFNFYDGAYPQAPLVEGSDGNFYGVAGQGGDNRFGAIFKISTKKKFSVLHSFTSSDGEYSSAGLVQGTDGNFYGNTWGASNRGAIYRITPAGHVSVLHSFDGTHGSHPEVMLVQHTAGILYGNTFDGGTHSYGTFYKLNGGLPPYARLVTFSGKVGDSIGILGQGFNHATAVSFNGTPAQFQVGADTFLTATVPDGAKTGPVTVTTTGGSLLSNRNFLVTPVITSFTPASGPVGTHVTITGVSLSQTSLVEFGSKSATFTVTSDKKVTAVVPANAKSGKITITTAGGAAISSTQFKVTP